MSNPTHPSTFVLLADRMIDGTGGPIVDRPAIHVVEGVIARVERRFMGWRADEGVAIFEEAGATVVPGLIDAHVHLAFPKADKEPGRKSMRALAQDHAARALQGGITTVRDLGSAAEAALWVRDEVKAGTLVGPRVLAAGAPITTSAGHCHWLGRIANTPTELVEATRQAIDEGVDVIKIMLTGGMLTPGSDPYSAQYSLSAVAAAVSVAHAAGVRVAAHSLSTAGVEIAIRAGVDTLEHGWTIAGGRQDFDPAIVREVAASGIVASVSAHDSLRSLLPWVAGGGALDELKRRLQPHRALADAGVPMVVHSDAGADPTRFEDFAASVAVFALGLETDPVSAIRASTSIPAGSLGLADRLGTIEPGRIADLLVVDGDPSTDVMALAQVRRVISGGRTVVAAGSGSYARPSPVGPSAGRGA